MSSGTSSRGMGTLPPRLPPGSAAGSHLTRTSSRQQQSVKSSQGEWTANTIEVVDHESREPTRSSSRGRSSRDCSLERSRSSSRGRQSLAKDASLERHRSRSSSRGLTYEASRRRSSSAKASGRERSVERSLNNESEQRRRARSTTSRSSRRVQPTTSGPVDLPYPEDNFKPRCRSRSARRRSSSSKRSSRSGNGNSPKKSTHSSNDECHENSGSYEPSRSRRRSKSASRRSISSSSQGFAPPQDSQGRTTGPLHDQVDEAPPPRNPNFATAAYSVEAGDGSTAAAQWGRNYEDESMDDDNERYVTALEIEIPNSNEKSDDQQDRYDFSPFKSAPRTSASAGPVDPWASPPARSIGGTSVSVSDCEDVVPYINPVSCDDEDTSAPTTIDTFLTGTDIHPNMIQSEEDVAQLRLFAGKLSADWGGKNLMAPALARRIRDFQYAQDKRRKKYGDERPWGILGLYDHLSGIRVDVEWAEDAAWRRSNGEPYLSWSDFEASKKKGINRPFFTYFILFVCTIIMIVSIGINGWKVEPFDVNPMIGPSAETLIKMGAKDSYLIVHENESWRLVSSIVLHAGLIHFFVNMLALWFVGAAIETSHGFIATTMVFIIPAVGGTVLSAIFLPEYITVGASGGIFGLIGACLADILVNWKLLFNDFVTENGKKHHHALVLVFLVLDIILNCIIGLTPYVDNFTHLGGMGYGFLCGISTMERVSSDFFGLSEGFWKRTKHIVVRFFGLIVSLIVIVATLIVLLEGDGRTTPCPDCTWLSCVPFPPWEGETEKWWYCDDCGRVTAEIVTTPDLHLTLNCPNGVSVEVPIDESDKSNTKDLEKALPSYCREYCPDINVRV